VGERVAVEIHVQERGTSLHMELEGESLKKSGGREEKLGRRRKPESEASDRLREGSLQRLRATKA